MSQRIVDKLSEEFRKRRHRNAAYSLRSFSRDLKLSPGRVSQYFSGQRAITPAAAKNIMNRLGLSPREQAEWMGLTTLQKESSTPLEPALLDQKIFELIAEPIHFTILSLIETKTFKNNPRWIAARIRSTVPEVQYSLLLLKELLLITESSGQLHPTYNQGVRSSDGVQNTALRQAHKRQLEQTLISLDSTPINLRDITSITVATDLAKIDEAKVLIKDFRRKLSALLETPKSSEVYRLQIQLIPLTDLEGENQT